MHVTAAAEQLRNLWLHAAFGRVSKRELRVLHDRII
jgi:hypothetical protein